ncbi:SDR family oxidoreductase [soil metagenome]
MVEDVSARRLEGRTAIVTGGSRGIGLGIAQRLAAEGARVCITAREPEGLIAAAATLPRGSCIWVAGRAGDTEHRAHVIEEVAGNFGGLDILVNNAGINPAFGPMIDIDVAVARKILEVNVLSTLGWAQAVYRDPRLAFASRKGSIVTISSVTGQIPSPGIGFYGVSKAAIAHLTKTLAVELGPQVRVNSIAPGVVKTRFAKALYEGREEQLAADYPLGRLGMPGDIAGAVVFLVSDDASWITGQVITVDGGLIAAGNHA